MGGWVGGAGRFGGWRNALCRKIARNWVFCLCEYEYVGLTTTNWTLLGWARVLDCVQHSRKLWVNGFCLIFLFFFFYCTSWIALFAALLRFATSRKVLTATWFFPSALTEHESVECCHRKKHSTTMTRLLGKCLLHSATHPFQWSPAKSAICCKIKFNVAAKVSGQKRGETGERSEWQPDSLLGCIINVIKCGNCLAQCKTDLELDVNASIEAPSTGPAPSLKLQAPSQLGPPFWLQLPICTRNRRRCH